MCYVRIIKAVTENGEVMITQRFQNKELTIPVTDRPYETITTESGEKVNTWINKYNM